MTAPIPTQHSIDRITFDVTGTPAPQGSKRHVGHGILVESSKHVKPWREAVKTAALEQLLQVVPVDHQGNNLWCPFGRDPVSVHLEFWFPHPLAHFRTGRYSHELRDNAPVKVATRPDIDKLVRSTLDALGEAGMWQDDAQVSFLIARKVYCFGHRLPGAHILIARDG